ncbi:hypothetical protein BC830DRAFT_559201 [Chytriomyces sp. MP71]|nr:hypothetical protein BC830DRAFT_559201 [Chytriomyces sp. MP71]
MQAAITDVAPGNVTSGSCIQNRSFSRNETRKVRKSRVQSESRKKMPKAKHHTNKAQKPARDEYSMDMSDEASEYGAGTVFPILLSVASAVHPLKGRVSAMAGKYKAAAKSTTRGGGAVSGLTKGGQARKQNTVKNPPAQNKGRTHAKRKADASHFDEDFEEPEVSKEKKRPSTARSHSCVTRESEDLEDPDTTLVMPIHHDSKIMDSTSLLLDSRKPIPMQLDSEESSHEFPDTQTTDESTYPLPEHSGKRLTRRGKRFFSDEDDQGSSSENEKQTFTMKHEESKATNLITNSANMRGANKANEHSMRKKYDGLVDPTENKSGKDEDSVVRHNAGATKGRKRAEPEYSGSDADKEAARIGGKRHKFGESEFSQMLEKKIAVTCDFLNGFTEERISQVQCLCAENETYVKNQSMFDVPRWLRALEFSLSLAHSGL